jgi:hypothetical protein
MCEDFVPNFGDKKLVVASRHILFQQGIFDQNNMAVGPLPPYFFLSPD